MFNFIHYFAVTHHMRKYISKLEKKKLLIEMFLPVAHNAINAWACLLMIPDFSLSGMSRERSWSRKSCGVTADKSHFR